MRSAVQTRGRGLPVRDRRRATARLRMRTRPLGRVCPSKQTCRQKTERARPGRSTDHGALRPLTQMAGPRRLLHDMADATCDRRRLMDAAIRSRAWMLPATWLRISARWNRPRCLASCSRGLTAPRAPAATPRGRGRIGAGQAVRFLSQERRRDLVVESRCGHCLYARASASSAGGIGAAGPRSRHRRARLFRPAARARRATAGCSHPGRSAVCGAGNFRLGCVKGCGGRFWRGGGGASLAAHEVGDPAAYPTPRVNESGIRPRLYHPTCDDALGSIKNRSTTTSTRARRTLALTAASAPHSPSRS